jgi:hypothetical protein
LNDGILRDPLRQAFFDLADLGVQPRQAGQVLLHDPFRVLAEFAERRQARRPLLRPGIAVQVFDPVIAEQGPQPQLHVSSLVDLLLAEADQPPQLTQLCRGQPDLGQITHPQQVRQQPGIAVVGPVGVLLHAGHESRMSQADAPARPLRQFVGQVRSAAASLERRVHDRSCRHRRRNLPPVVLDLPVHHDLAAFIQHADLHEVLVIIQTPKQPFRVYNLHVRCSWKRGSFDQHLS